MTDVFYAEFKNEHGEWEPLGIMTMRKALEWAWENDHCDVNIVHIGKDRTP